jgi:hypothetical protein
MGKLLLCATVLTGTAAAGPWCCWPGPRQLGVQPLYAAEESPTDTLGLNSSSRRDRRSSGGHWRVKYRPADRPRRRRTTGAAGEQRTGGLPH